MEVSPQFNFVDLSSDDLSEDDDDPVVKKSNEDLQPEIIESVETQMEEIQKPTEDSGIIHSREYQLEMYEESLRRNIIVAMETGTGKTQVAVLRIQAEIERSIPDKLVWFLAPTVALGAQQTGVLKSQIPSAQIKFLSGSDGVDTWTDVRTWDDYLENVHVVVSTHQVLLDAISHAFVRIDRLSLIVFDEAHNCVGKHPGSKIMGLYHNYKTAGLPIPAILGLTASPIMKSKLEALELIEKTLDAVCRSPTINRDELMSIVKRPVIHYAVYSQPDQPPSTSAMRALGNVYHNLDIFDDPYIRRCTEENTERSRAQLKVALETMDTYVFGQVRSLWSKSKEISKELGPWAADYFISVAVTQFLQSIEKNDEFFREWRVEEQQYLAKALRNIKLPTVPLFDDVSHIGISSKVSTLVHQLLNSDDGAIGIVFVREVATVAVLAHMLSIHSSIKKRFRIGTMIGTSERNGRKRDLSTLGKINGTKNLDEFRSGKVNLLIGTNVLEEGIDILACNMVVCFDKPDNMKAYIQRRGRARAGGSRLVMMTDKPTSQLDEWAALEAEMKKRYEDDMRQAQELLKLEDLEEPQIDPLYIPETRAYLDFDQAKSHLEHFCRKISSRQYIDSKPYYLFKRSSESSETPHISATVVLPMSLPAELRRVEGNGLWYSEKNASKDAAFKAYKAIYEAGLLNDNLLPLRDEFLRDVDPRASEVEVHERWNPWVQVARAWNCQSVIYQRRLRLLDDHDKVVCEFDASLPVIFPELPDMEIFWTKEKPWKIQLDETKAIFIGDLQADQSPALIDLAYRHRQLKVRDDARMALHLQSTTEDIPFQQLLGQNQISSDSHLDNTILIRDPGSVPWLFKNILPSNDPDLKTPEFLRGEPVDSPWLVLEKWPPRKNGNFLRPPDQGCTPPLRKFHQWPAHLCRTDGTHISNVCFGTLIPSVTYIIEIYLVAYELCNTLLKDVGYKDISLVTTAISSKGSSGVTNYERIEFLGDNILKMLTTATVTAEHPTYPEGYLDAIKTRIVSNTRLYRAAIETGLDKFIITKSFRKKWRPLYVDEILTEPGDNYKRKMSTKTLADVVEALIGAAYIDGGMDKALKCVQIFLPEVHWHTYESACAFLFQQRPMSTEVGTLLAPLEELIGYSFRNKNLLVEAATHSSFGYVNSTGSCMERLEFLGDAVLDSVITTSIWNFEREMSQHEMHLLRAACVNADLLGFISMEWTIPQETTEIIDNNNTKFTYTNVPFWKFMRHVSRELGDGQRGAEERFKCEREPILDAIYNGSEYPWVQLAHLRIPKFFSDFFESVLGAVWVDSGASTMEACAYVVERAGILPYLRRMVSDNIDILHPKNHLGILAGSRLEKVEYQTEVRDTENGTKELFCRVLVNEQVIVEVGGGVTPEEIQVKAAYRAWKNLIKEYEERDAGRGGSTAETEVMNLRLDE
ncbi:uncharacterized protein F4822DRAFT_437418 [Hypoxylon trugodes]|uniref:uncharacterized protein n=1 Tax=Hypoxylon trugodes TaxID=326681 RepID=UPI002192A33F|nr:uncharacterized protein F4822DRAFT_437418 [Hypoxylon trugodes]KAI1388879.1 hypothetical protein F4822DRAFT_437418 [Hypoxylon trugodes]